jgi:tetratricopeptide (TPR) repeat protein
MGLRGASLLPLLALACAAERPKQLIVPDEMRRPLATGPSVAEAAAPRLAARPSPPRTDDPTGAKSAAASASAAAAASTASPAGPPATHASLAPQRPVPAVATDPAQRYTLRLVERGRVWELELPENAGAYEVRIPLGPGIETPTAADQEMLGNTPPAGSSKSYLASLAKVGEMYANHRFELALIEIVDLEQQYPKDARILAMKGSLYRKLGKGALAREAWKKALELDPSDTTVAEALRALKEE